MSFYLDLGQILKDPVVKSLKNSHLNRVGNSLFHSFALVALLKRATGANCSFHFFEHKSDSFFLRVVFVLF